MFLTEVRRTALLAAGSRVVVACSGGGDSTALAVLLAETRAALALADLSLAHLDHGLRPESRADAETVERLAGSLALPLVAARRSVERRAGESPEAAARRVRYGFLREVAEVRGADVVVTAHTADDQAETVLLRMLRGTGVRGLRGIPARRSLTHGVSVERPLLALRRVDLRTFLVERGLAWCEDPTNEGGNDRARLRARVLPVLEQVSGRDPVPLFVRLAQNAAETGDDALAIARRFVTRTGDALELCAGHDRLPRGALRRALGEAAGELRGTPGLTRREAERLLHALLGATGETVSGIAVRQGPRGAEVVRSSERPDDLAPVPLRDPGPTAVAWAGVVVHLHGSVDAHRAPSGAEVVDRATLRGALVLRPPHRGERFVPLGGGPPRRVRSLLAKRGIAAARRSAYPIVADDEGVVVVPGVTLAERVRVTAETTDRLAIGATPLRDG